MSNSYDKEIKFCAECGEQDLIFINHSHCENCLKKRSEKRKEILKI